MKEFLIKFLENNTNIVILLFLFFFLLASHGFQIHYNRPDKVITWNENMITGIFTAMVAKLK